jgi:hypothetical protein
MTVRLECCITRGFNLHRLRGHCLHRSCTRVCEYPWHRRSSNLHSCTILDAPLLAPYAKHIGQVQECKLDEVLIGGPGDEGHVVSLRGTAKFLVLRTTDPKLALASAHVPAPHHREQRLLNRRAATGSSQKVLTSASGWCGRRSASTVVEKLPSPNNVTKGHPRGRASYSLSRTLNAARPITMRDQCAQAPTDRLGRPEALLIASLDARLSAGNSRWLRTRDAFLLSLLRSASTTKKGTR